MVELGRTEHARFPALDPEPPPRSWRWRLGAAAVLLGAVAVVAVLAWLVASAAGGAPAKVAVVGGPSGRVLFMSSAGVFGLATPEGGGTQDLMALGSHAMSGGTYAIASLDGTRVVAGDGTVLSVTGESVSAQPSHVDLATEQQMQLAGLNPFSDGDQDLVLLGGGYAGYPLSDAAVVLVRWRSGAHLASLGTADQSAGAAGDPQLPGAFVAVALPASSAGEGDSEVELRDAGQSPVVLATAASVDRALGQPSNTYFVLSPYPDPAGDKIAITVNASQPGLHPSIGVIVVSRTGRLLAALDASGRPEGGYGVQWSPDGKSLLYVTEGRAGQELAEWTPGSGPPTARPLPDPGDAAGDCIWSSNGTELLCAADNLQSRSINWVSGPAEGGPLTVHSGPGMPVEFLMTGR